MLENRTSSEHEGGVLPRSLPQQERMLFAPPLLDVPALLGSIAIAIQQPAFGIRPIDLHPHRRVQQRRQLIT